MDLLYVLITIAVALAGYLIGKRIGIPVPAMIGSMIFVGVLGATTGLAVMPKPIKIFSQGVSGAFIGMSVRRSDVRNIPHLLGPLVLLMGMFTVNTFVLGFLLQAVFGWDLMTGLLSGIAGGIADVSLIAIDLDCDASTVAIMQTMRLVCVLAFFPTWVGLLTRGEEYEDANPLDRTDEPCHTWLDTLIDTDEKRTVFTIIVAIIFGALGYVSGVPAGALLFSLVGSAALNLATDTIHMPLPVKRMAQLFAGSLIGCTITPETVANLPGLILPIIIMVALYTLLNLIFALIMSKTGQLNKRDALFASSPGGASDMSLIAADLGADLTKIAIIQIIRSIYAAGLMPQIAVLVNNLFG